MSPPYDPDYWEQRAKDAEERGHAQLAQVFRNRRDKAKEQNEKDKKKP